MKVYSEIEQGTTEWHNIRWGKIGGTTSKELHTKTDTLLNKLVAAKLEGYDPTDDSFTNKNMERGNMLEPFARKYLEEYLGVKFEQVGWIEHDICKILGMSPDGITADHRIMCEIKCPTLAKHVSYIRANVVPPEHVDQVVAPFSIHPDLKYNYFCSYRPECKIPVFIKRVELGTLVNIGTEKRPVLETVQSYANMKLIEAMKIEEEVNVELERILEI